MDESFFCSSLTRCIVDKKKSPLQELRPLDYIKYTNCFSHFNPLLTVKLQMIIQQMQIMLF